MFETGTTIRVLIADDHPVVRQGLSAVIASQPDLDVVGEAKNLAELLRALDETTPDILVLDLDLDIRLEDELGALKAVRERDTDIRIVVFTAHEEERYIVDAIEYGVEGYILKSADFQELLSAIHVVHRGGTMMQPSVASKLMQYMRRGGPSEKTDQMDFGISPREFDVLKLMAEGASNSQIAGRLNISERTVKFHVSSILGKLEAENRTAAVLKATREGVLPNTLN